MKLFQINLVILYNAAEEKTMNRYYTLIVVFTVSLITVGSWNRLHTGGAVESKSGYDGAAIVLLRRRGRQTRLCNGRYARTGTSEHARL